MIILKIAFRNIFRQKRRTFFTGLTMVASFVLMSVSLSLSEGTYDELINLFTGNHTGHIQIHKKGYLDKQDLYTTLPYNKNLENRIKKLPNVVGITPRIYFSALAFVDKKTTGAKLIGIDPNKEKNTTTIYKKIQKGRFLSDSLNEIIIGNGLATVLHAKIGEQLVLITQGADGSIANDLFKIVGILGDDKDTSERNNCYMSIETAQNFLSLYNQIHEYSIKLTDYKKARKMSVKIQQLVNKMGLKDARVLPWQVIEKEFYKSMKADKSGNYIFHIILVIIVAIGVLDTVLMSILERMVEFGVLKAIGTRRSYIFAMIILETFILSIMCVIIGSFIGLGIDYFLSIHGIQYPEPLSIAGIIVTRMRGTIIPYVFWLPSVVIISSATIVSVFPALKAMHVAPAKALRSF